MIDRTRTDISRYLRGYLNAMPSATYVVVLHFVLLGFTGYPVDEWTFVTVVFYLFVILFGFIASQSTYRMSSKLRSDLFHQGDVTGANAPSKPVAVGAYVMERVLFQSLVYGSAMAGVIMAAEYKELTPFHEMYHSVAYWLFAGGMAGYALLLGIPAMSLCLGGNECKPAGFAREMYRVAGGPLTRPRRFMCVW